MLPVLNEVLRAQTHQLTAPRHHLEHGPEPRVAQLSRDNQRRQTASCRELEELQPTSQHQHPSPAPRQPLGHPWPLTWLA